MITSSEIEAMCFAHPPSCGPAIAAHHRNFEQARRQRLEQQARHQANIPSKLSMLNTSDAPEARNFLQLPTGGRPSGRGKYCGRREGRVHNSRQSLRSLEEREEDGSLDYDYEDGSSDVPCENDQQNNGFTEFLQQASLLTSEGASFERNILLHIWESAARDLHRALNHLLDMDAAALVVPMTQNLDASGESRSEAEACDETGSIDSSWRIYDEGEERCSEAGTEVSIAPSWNDVGDGVASVSSSWQGVADGFESIADSWVDVDDGAASVASSWLDVATGSTASAAERKATTFSTAAASQAKPSSKSWAARAADSGSNGNVAANRIAMPPLVCRERQPRHGVIGKRCDADEEGVDDLLDQFDMRKNGNPNWSRRNRRRN